MPTKGAERITQKMDPETPTMKHKEDTTTHTLLERYQYSVSGVKLAAEATKASKYARTPMMRI